MRAMQSFFSRVTLEVRCYAIASSGNDQKDFVFKGHTFLFFRNSVLNVMDDDSVVCSEH